MNDAAFFAAYARRQARIRLPDPGEMADKYQTLGMHDVRRRRILVTRLARPLRRALKTDFLRIPFLAFSDETIEDTDEVLLPLLKELLDDAVRRELPSARPQIWRVGRA